MNSQDILGYINGVRLTAEGKGNFEKYGFKTKAPASTKLPWLEPIIETADDARLFGVICKWNNWYTQALTRDSIAEFNDWKDRLQKPSRIFEDVVLDEVADLRLLTKDSMVGAKLLNEISGKRIHFVTFAYIDELTQCTEKWTSINWKIAKKQFDVYRKIVIPQKPYVSQLAKYLKNKFTNPKTDI